MEALRARADGVLIGAGTLHTEDPPLIIRDPVVRGSRAAAKGSHIQGISPFARCCRKLEDMRFFRSPETEKLVFTTARTPPGFARRRSRYAPGRGCSVDQSGRVDLVLVLGGCCRSGSAACFWKGAAS